MSLSEQVPARSSGGVDRRRFIGYVVGGTTLVAAAELAGQAPRAYAGGIPSVPQIPEIYDLEDLQNDAALPTSLAITIAINDDGTASFALPRTEVGQGTTTSTAMNIADEFDLPVEKIRVTLAPARPELQFNQLTGGSNTTVSTYFPIRIAAATARNALLDAAAIALGSVAERLRSKQSVVYAPDGRSIGYGELAPLAASPETRKVEV